MKNLKTIDKAILAFCAFLIIVLILFTTYYQNPMTKQQDQPKLQRALTPKNVVYKKRKLLPFQGPFFDLIGKPELTGTWLIWGDSGNGKTTFVMQLCKYLTKFCKVNYDSLEEGNSESIKLAFIRTDMLQVGSKLLLLDMEPIEQLKIRLRKRKSAQVVVIDSVQYAGLTYDQYKALRAEFPKKLFILISHADGKLPEGSLAKKIRYDAFVKMHVEGYMAFALSRYKDGESQPFTIWEEGAEKYWANKL